MPSTYAHYRLGREVFATLPENIRKQIEPYRELFNIGLHGPDILFYYKPMFPNRVNQTGFGMHDRIALPLFERWGEMIGSKEDPRPYFAYLYGFICHYVLDSECHGYIDEKIAQSGIAHTEIEGELDRELMLKDGHDPTTHYLTEHIQPSRRNCEVIADFFENVTADEVQKAIRSMKWYNGLLRAPHKGKRLFVYSFLLITGNYREIHGLVINYKPNLNCMDSTEILTGMYEKAFKQSLKLIREYEECILEGIPLNTRYRLTFGSQEQETVQKTTNGVTDVTKPPVLSEG
ncbi:MAG TPA: zinc dependent phospholipase C family protein [Lachnospiraceae bacterium]|nr:zinc dependent phospholipase C family protein [Lachnospiraceae bacterium]